MSDASQTPLAEAVSIITIGAILVAVGCYAGAIQNVPGLAPGVLWIASQMYGWWPALNALNGAQIPILVGSATVGGALFLFGIPLAPLLAARFAKAQLQNVERSTARLKRTGPAFKKRSVPKMISSCTNKRLVLMRVSVKRVISRSDRDQADRSRFRVCECPPGINRQILKAHDSDRRVVSPGIHGVERKGEGISQENRNGIG